MREAREEQKFEKHRVHEATRILKQRKLDRGERLVARVTEYLAHVVDGSDHDSKNSEESRPKRAKRSSRYNQVINCETDRFSASLKQSDAKQLSMERERLAFEREKLKEETRRYETQRVDRRAEDEQERAERKEEQESQDRMELENFKVMVNVLRQSKLNFTSLCDGGSG